MIGGLEYEEKYIYRNQYSEIDSTITIEFDTHSEPKSRTQFYKYQFDEKGNWVKKSVLEDGKEVMQETRVIKYY
jgi:hypothetical protein